MVRANYRWKKNYRLPLYRSAYRYYLHDDVDDDDDLITEEASQGEVLESGMSSMDDWDDDWYDYRYRYQDVEGEQHDIDGSQSEGSTTDDDESVSADNNSTPKPPPPYGYPDDDGNVPRPEFVLIEPYAYFADRTNATTAYCETSALGARGTIKVTFCAARPPLASYFCFHATAFGYTGFAVKPHIAATEADGALVLLGLVIGRDPSNNLKRHYFVYDARGPSLRHLPHPGRHAAFNDHSFAIVRMCGWRCGQDDHDCGDYVIAAQVRHAPYQEFMWTSALCLYHSDTNTWSQKPVLLTKKQFISMCHFTSKALNIRGDSQFHVTSKTFAIGGDGGTVAWVDLCNNILFCNVLDACPKLRVVRLPSESLRRLSSRPGNPRSVQNVAFVDGLIKYVEMEARRSRVKTGLPAGESSRTSYSWKATIWSIKTSRKARWRKDYELESSDISEPLPKLRVDEGTDHQPTLSALKMRLPSLSLQDDGIVYFLAKNGYRGTDRETWVIAVDMRNKTVQKLDEFNPTRTRYFEYDASRISKYLKAAPVYRHEE